MTTTPARWTAAQRGSRPHALAPLAVAALLAAFAVAAPRASATATASHTPRRAADDHAKSGKSAKSSKPSKTGRPAKAAPAHGKARPEASAKASTKPHSHTRPAPPPDTEPIPVYQTHNRRLELRGSRVSEQASQPAPAAHPGPRPAPATVAGAPSRPTATGPALTVNDFLHAAGEGSTPVARAAAPPSSVFASGVSHPDDDDTLPLSQRTQIQTSNNDSAPAPQPARKPQPVVVTLGMIAPAHPEVLPQRARAEIDPAPIAHVDVPPPAPAPSRSTVVASAFGPEVDILADASAARPSVAAKKLKPTAPVVARSAPPATSTLPVAERDEITEAAVRPMILPALYSRSGRLIIPAPLKGSREVLVHQNTMADADGLERIENESQLNQMHSAGLIVAFPESAALHVNDELPVSHRAARPWTVRFAADTARNFYARFHQPLIVTSAVRTIEYQLRLERVNGNAAGIDGATASPHLTGQALDFAKGRMSAAELAWMRAYLRPIMQAGLIDVEEEFQQSCFHVSVYRRYAPPAHRRLQRTSMKADARPLRAEPSSDDDER